MGPQLFLAATCLLAALCTMTSAAAERPCDVPAARALVLGSGGSKGAFQAGAVYHLVVHRGCDFVEISGTSVGALNGALLAQASRSDDAAVSLANMRAAAENLIDEWTSIESSREVFRSRPLGKLRFALFGLDSIENFAPLRAFVREHVSLERLAAGRELRVGTMSIDDGRYHEILINRDGHIDRDTAHDFILGSAIVPTFARMPVITPPEGGAALQFADGGVRHATPVRSYFQACTPMAECIPLTGQNTPPHPRIEQLFVVVTSPYARFDDRRPIFDPKAIDRRSGHIDDGRRILVRLFDLLIDTLYRDDLDDALMYNDILTAQVGGAADPTRTFPLGSFNRSADAALPYEIAVIAPEREDADPMSIFEVEPDKQRREMYCGCLAADEWMVTHHEAASFSEKCEARFPPLRAKRGSTPPPLEPAQCR